MTELELKMLEALKLIDVACRECGIPVCQIPDIAFAHQFVVMAINAALEKHERERAPTET